MLRIAVISLLVANLLLLGFQGDKPAAQPETIAKKAVVEDSGIPTIHLFGEMMQDQDLMSGSRQCFSLGPFHSDEDKNEVRALLRKVSASITERETRALVEKGYWVFMPPYESLLEANQVLLSIQALGLKDIAVIYNGEWKNAISLGYFLRQENALRRKKELENRGFAPKMRVQRQSETRYWLDFEQSPGSGLITMDMQDRPNDFMQRSLPCPDQNPFEITAGVSENPAVETEQPQTQLPEENIEPQPEEISEPPPEEIIKPQPAEEGSSQQEDGDGAQPAEEIDTDPEESIDTTPVDNAEVAVPGSAIETDPENGLGAEPQNTDEAVTDQTIVAEPENDPEAELQNSNEAEPEASENLVDDTLQQQVEVPDEGDGLQATEDGEKAVPAPVIETEPENSVGTGPVIGFGTESEDSDEIKAENSDETGVEDSLGTESEDSNGTETDGG